VKFAYSRRAHATILIAMAILGSQLSVGHADEKSRRVVNGIFRILIESQGRGGQPAPRPSTVRPSQATPEMAKVRVALSGYQKESAGLYGLLQKESQRQVQVRTLLGDASKVQARSDSLARRSLAVSDHRLLASESIQLDRDWRALSYRLEQLPGLSAPCRECIGRMDGYGTQLCGALNFEPQVDRRALVRQSDTLVIHLRGLIEDLDFELRRNRDRQKLIIAAGQVHQAAIAFAEAAHEGATYQQLVTGYRRFLKLWSPFARIVCGIESHFIERSTLRVQEADQAIHELLWLPRDLDRNILIQLTTGISAEVDRIFSTVTLAMLIQLPGYDDIPSDASEFYGVCANFADCVERQEGRDDLVSAYEYLPASWVAFSRHFRSVDHAMIRRSLAEIESRLVALREPLGIPGGFDLTKARRHAASVQHLAEHLSDDVEEWLASTGKYDKDRRDLEKLGTIFMHSSRKLHAALAGTPHLPTIRQLCDQCIEDWSLFHGRVTNCDAPNREHLEEIEIRITTALIELEAMLL
jgi:hypothetical protein